MTKSAWKNFTLNAAEKFGLINLLQKIDRGNGQYLYVVMYHRVEEIDTVPWLDPSDISTTPQKFEDQMKLIAQKYHPVSAEEVLEAVRSGAPLPKDAVLVTVDDGYRSFLNVIFPICSRYGIQPLLFQPTAYVGTGTFWWDKIFQIIHLSEQKEIETPIGKFSLLSKTDQSNAQHQIINAMKRLPFAQVMNWVDSTHSKWVHLSEEQQQNTLTWDELRQLTRAGVSIASHTHTHPIMTQIPLEEALEQVLQSQQIIQKELGSTLPIFAFPNGKPGDFNADLINMLYSIGIEMIFLVVNGRTEIRPGNHKITLPRMAVWQNQTIPQFHLRLTLLANSFKR